MERLLSIAERVIELINHQTENADTITQYRKPLWREGTFQKVILSD